MFLRYGLAATAVVVATAAVVSNRSTVAAAAAEEDEDKDDYPGTVITTKVTHLRKPPFLFSSHTMPETEKVLPQQKSYTNCIKLNRIILKIITFDENKLKNDNK